MDQCEKSSARAVEQKRSHYTNNLDDNAFLINLIVQVYLRICFKDVDNSRYQVNTTNSDMIFFILDQCEKSARAVVDKKRSHYTNNLDDNAFLINLL